MRKQSCCLGSGLGRRQAKGSQSVQVGNEDGRRQGRRQEQSGNPGQKQQVYSSVLQLSSVLLKSSWFKDTAPATSKLVGQRTRLAMLQALLGILEVLQHTDCGSYLDQCLNGEIRYVQSGPPAIDILFANAHLPLSPSLTSALGSRYRGVSNILIELPAKRKKLILLRHLFCRGIEVFAP